MTTPLALDPEAVRLASTAQFAKTEGGPMIAMSESALASWNGMFEPDGSPADGECDYDRACGSFELIDVGSTKALTLEMPAGRYAGI